MDRIKTDRAGPSQSRYRAQTVHPLPQVVLEDRQISTRHPPDPIPTNGFHFPARSIMVRSMLAFAMLFLMMGAVWGQYPFDGHSVHWHSKSSTDFGRYHGIGFGAGYHNPVSQSTGPRSAYLRSTGLRSTGLRPTALASVLGATGELTAAPRAPSPRPAELRGDPWTNSTPSRRATLWPVAKSPQPTP